METIIDNIVKGSSTMLVRKVIDVNAPLTEEQKARLAVLKQMTDDDIVYDEDCPKLT